jgi:LacI family transcriptional regulator
MKKGVTIKDIAIKLNMSVSTVSKALNNHPSISSDTKQRVQALAREWNYVPNETARHFKLNKTFTIGLLIPDLLDQFYVLCINGVEKIAAERSYNVIIAQTYDSAAAEDKITASMVRNRVDGVIAALSKETEQMNSFKRLEDLGIPVVFVARPPREPGFHYIVADDAAATNEAIRLLIDRGHRRIAHLKGPHAMAVSRLRSDSYRRALAQQGVSYDDLLVREVDFSAESTYCAMEALMHLSSPPTAIFSFKNYINLDAIEYLRKNNPEKLQRIEFIGFGNLPMLQYLHTKPIASIEESPAEMGEAAAQLLFELIETMAINDLPPRTIQIPCRLVEHK